MTKMEYCDGRYIGIGKELGGGDQGLVVLAEDK